MIHAYLFVTQNRKDREDHGPEFHKHMHRINKAAGTKISVRLNAISKFLSIKKKCKENLYIYYRFIIHFMMKLSIIRNIFGGAMVHVNIGNHFSVW